MPRAELRIADEFVYDLTTITSQRLLKEIREAVSLLADHPEMESPDVRPSLTRAFGSGIRKLTVSPFVIVYRYHDDIVDVLSCVYGPRVR